MESRPATAARYRSADDDFVYTEFYVDWREPLPPARFGNKRFMWGCVAFAATFATWLASRQ